MLSRTERAHMKDNAKMPKSESHDIVDLIIEDHKPLKELIAVMKDADQPQEVRFDAFREFAPTLIAHAKPEELTLYVFMKHIHDLREEAFEGDVEHSMADQLVEEIKRTTDVDLRAARIKVLAEIVEHHIKEEEEDLLPDFKKHSEPKQRENLGTQFLSKKIDYLAAGDDNIIPDPKLEQIESLKH